MAKPRGKSAGGRPGKGKGAARARRPTPKARGAKPAGAPKVKRCGSKKEEGGSAAHAGAGNCQARYSPGSRCCSETRSLYREEKGGPHGRDKTIDARSISG